MVNLESGTNKCVPTPFETAEVQNKRSIQQSDISSFLVAFLPSVADEYKVAATWSDQPVKRCPFIFKVYKATKPNRFC